METVFDMDALVEVEGLDWMGGLEMRPSEADTSWVE